MEENYREIFKAKFLKHFPDALYIILLILAVSLYPIVNRIPEMLNDSQEVLGEAVTTSCTAKIPQNAEIIQGFSTDKSTTIHYSADDIEMVSVFDSNCTLLFQK